MHGLRTSNGRERRLAAAHLAARGLVAPAVGRGREHHRASGGLLRRGLARRLLHLARLLRKHAVARTGEEGVDGLLLLRRQVDELHADARARSARLRGHDVHDLAGQGEPARCAGRHEDDLDLGAELEGLLGGKERATSRDVLAVGLAKLAHLVVAEHELEFAGDARVLATLDAGGARGGGARRDLRASLAPLVLLLPPPLGVPPGPIIG